MKFRSPLERLRYLGKLCQFGGILIAILGALYIAIHLYTSYLQISNTPAQVFTNGRLVPAGTVYSWPYYLSYYSSALELLFPTAFYALMLYAAGCLIEHFFPLPESARKEIELDDLETASQNGQIEDEEDYERVVIVPLSKVRK